jgi:hypothetical protein
MKLLVKALFTEAQLRAAAEVDRHGMDTKLVQPKTLDGRLDFNGIPVSIEVGRSRNRIWHNPHDGTSGTHRMHIPYGYIRGVTGMDGDELDVFVGPWREAPNVYVVTIMQAPDFKSIDEQKVFLGMQSSAEARSAFHKHYDNPRFFGTIKTVPFQEFKAKIQATPGKPVIL